MRRSHKYAVVGFAMMVSSLLIAFALGLFSDFHRNRARYEAAVTHARHLFAQGEGKPSAIHGCEELRIVEFRSSWWTEPSRGGPEMPNVSASRTPDGLIQVHILQMDVHGYARWYQYSDPGITPIYECDGHEGEETTPLDDRWIQRVSRLD